MDPEPIEETSLRIVRGVMIVDADRLFLDAITCLIGQDPGLEVLGVADSPEQALEQMSRHAPHLAIMSSAMLASNPELLVAIQRKSPTTRVLGISSATEALHVVPLIRAGACGLVLRGGGWPDLIQGIHSVLRGEFYVSHGLTTTAGNSNANTPDPKVLTARQKEVLMLMAEGLATREIAKKLFISAKTVESHRAQIMDRLNIGTLAGLVKYAIREGFTSLDH